jgi:hypothetical protein
MTGKGVSRVLRQVCRTLSKKDTKESLEYIAGVWSAEEESPRLAAVADAARAACMGNVGKTVVSYIFVRYFRQPYKYDVLSAAVSMVTR